MEANAADAAKLVSMNFLLGKRRGKRGFQKYKILCPNGFRNGRSSLSMQKILSTLYIFSMPSRKKHKRKTRMTPLIRTNLFPGVFCLFILSGTKTNPETADTFSTKVWVTDWQ